MKRFKKILFISRCHEEYQNSLYHAVKLAYQNNAEIKFMIISHALPDEFESYQQKLKVGYITKFEEYIDMACRDVNINRGQLDISISINLSELPDMDIVKKAVRGEHDLIIKSIDQVKRGFKSFDMKLLRNVPCPIWFFRSSSTNKDISKIAAAIDANRTDERNVNLSKKIVTIGNNICKDYHSQLDIICCWKPSIPDTAINNALVEISEEELAKVHSKQLHHLNTNIENIIENSSIDSTSHFNLHTLKGDPEDIIPEFITNSNIEMIIMGTVNRTGIPGFFIGNTAENVLNEITCSLLALKPEGFKSPISANTKDNPHEKEN